MILQYIQCRRNNDKITVIVLHLTNLKQCDSNLDGVTRYTVNPPIEVIVCDKYNNNIIIIEFRCLGYYDLYIAIMPAVN